MNVTMNSNSKTDCKNSQRNMKNIEDKSAKPAEDKLNEKIIDENFRKRVETMMKNFATLPENWDDLTIREQRDWACRKMRKHYINLPESLEFFCVGSMISDDCKRLDEHPKPEWLDHEKFLRGQRFAMDNFAGISFAQLLSLYILFSFEEGLKPLIITGKSSEPYTAFKRYLSTAQRIQNWYTTDIWTKNTAGYRDIQMVRKMHSMVRETLLNSSHEKIDESSIITNSWCPTRDKVLNDFRESCRPPGFGQCPYLFSEEEKFKRPKGLHQGEMAATQSGFVALVILYPQYFGIHGFNDDDLDAYCHVWRSIGYLLGIEDEFNFCTGSLEEVKQRSRDFLEYWAKPNLRNITPEWEHMLRCVTSGIKYYFPGTSYENTLLYLADLLEIPMPRLRSSLSYQSWIQYLSLKKTFYWTARFRRVTKMMNLRLIKSIDKALNFTDKHLEDLQEKSKCTMSKGIVETNEARRRNELSASTYWHKAPFLVFLSTCFLLNFPIIVKEFAKKLFRNDGATSLTS